MTPVIYKLHPTQIEFPSATAALADPNGLLALGGDLSPERLINAYRNGIFPWYSDTDPLLWWSPDPRGILELDDYIINRSFAKFLKKNPYTCSINRAFKDVITLCSQVPRGDQGTWITSEMVNAYIRLHQLGYAHSIEVWDGKSLVGGLYGIMVGGCFCGESMFHLKSNASKVAYRALVYWMKKHQADFIDCQLQNEFLQTMGVSEISRELYLQKLAIARQAKTPIYMWEPQPVDFNEYL